MHEAVRKYRILMQMNWVKVNCYSHDNVSEARNEVRNFHTWLKLH